MKKKLQRSDNMLGGVCGGLGNYFGIDPIIFRAGFVLGSLFALFPIVVYVVLWMIVPQK